MRQATKKSLSSIAVLALAAGLTLTAAAGEPRIHVENAWSRPMAPGSGAGAGYITIRNEGTSTDRLVSAETERAERVELHRTTVEDGVMRMRPLPDGIEIAPGETVELEPGGLHIMFLGVAEPFETGDHIAAILRFEAAGEKAVRFEVGVAPAEQHGHGHDTDHGHGHGHDTDKAH